MENNTKIDSLMRQKGKLMLVAKSPLTVKQVLTIFQRTPSQHIRTRPAKGGGEWTYVSAVYVKKVLNFVFGWMWSFEIMSEREIGGFVVVRGRLTILDPKTRASMIVKEQYGRSEIKHIRNTKELLDIGNDYKAAASDALKKCASELGIASDVYGSEEFRELGDPPSTPPKKPTAQDAITGFECNHSECAIPITRAEADYSKKMYGKPLCRTHQRTAKLIRK